MQGGTPVENNKSKKQEMIEKLKIRKKEGRVVRRIVTIVTLVILLIVGIVGVSGYFYVKSALEPIDPEATDEIPVEIPMGSGISTISSILEENGIIKNARIFKYYTKFKNESNFQAGNYILTQSMTLDEIIKSLKTGKVYHEPVFSLTIPEGLTLEQISEIIAKHTEYTAEEFMELVTSKEFIQNMMGTFPDLITEEVSKENIRYALEGYLYPSTYSFYEEKPSLQEIVSMMISLTNDVVGQYDSLLAEKEMTPHQLLTFASLLEEEATAQTDRETIASVFYNRLDIDMPLQTDPTVLYALGSHKDRVLYEDLEVDNPYNTYVIQGLPPGPIANAGKISIEAALNPTDTDYLYFLADTEGNNHFAKTYEEHLQNIDQFLEQ
ncbi:endolytic transglycosylase MltG [Ureibacillus aquaedulcis]|uniref:Endolytic murein transglycosylase n=1 Tax=Ureibacillus aquaedulcis TaxID=3058421 RepID=A0ABT8GV52_9BACL|nr:endolytic transglycosylase MltG [Ureibacillus sp. BA0131]MDN4495291.1 endolytic transglycosylase MltG [Ureibacillus sp. BA0131]